MQKINISLFLLILTFQVFGQQSITILPNPTPNGTLSNLQIDADGKLIKTTGNPNTPGPYYLNISNFDFLPNRTNAIGLEKFVRDDALGNGTCYFETTATNADWMIAPVDFPDGAVLTNMKVWYFDHYPNESMTIKLLRRAKGVTNLPSPESTLASTTTVNSLTRILKNNDIPIPNLVVDNILYHYFIRIYVRELDIDATYFWGGFPLAIRNVELRYN